MHPKQPSFALLSKSELMLTETHLFNYLWLSDNSRERTVQLLVQLLPNPVILIYGSRGYFTHLLPCNCWCNHADHVNTVHQPLTKISIHNITLPWTRNLIETLLAK